MKGCLTNLLRDTIVCGDTLEVLREMESESIDCCITSPPYWSLRDYGIDGQLGLEPTFNEYITNLQTIFDEVYRVLKREGTLWVDIGDTYAGTANGGSRWGTFADYRTDGGKGKRDINAYRRRPQGEVGNVKTKSLCNIPFRFAISMTDSGWIQRNTIIWHKPSCMPSSAKDRFTVDFEYVFFFTKNKKYYFEQQFEASVAESVGSPTTRNMKETHGMGGGNTGINAAKLRAKDVGGYQNRNKRTVWRINPACYSGAHFAVFPEKLVEPMINACCPSDGIVIDPFSGSGTTCVVAKKLGRHHIGLDINPDYCKMSEKRIKEML